MTETSPVLSANNFGMTRFGSVGKPVPDTEIKIAEDGELCVKGPSVMEGYWNLPEKTAEVFDDDGFFRTGDIAHLDDEGPSLHTRLASAKDATAGATQQPNQPTTA